MKDKPGGQAKYNIDGHVMVVGKVFHGLESYEDTPLYSKWKPLINGNQTCRY